MNGRGHETRQLSRVATNIEKDKSKDVGVHVGRNRLGLEEGGGRSRDRMAVPCAVPSTNYVECVV